MFELNLKFMLFRGRRKEKKKRKKEKFCGAFVPLSNAMGYVCGAVVNYPTAVYCILGYNVSPSHFRLYNINEYKYK